MELSLFIISITVALLLVDTLLRRMMRYRNAWRDTAHKLIARTEECERLKRALTERELSEIHEEHQMSQEEIERMAEMIFSKYVQPLMDRIDELELSNAELKCTVSKRGECLRSIQNIRWGNDGDCGALEMIDKVL